MKNSKQRSLVLQAVQNNRSHPTAETIHNIVKEEIPNISLGTVYRNLNRLSDDGYIKRIKFSNESDRFDGMTYNHYHMVCEQCKRVFDISSKGFKINEAIAKKTGYKILEHEMILKGICTTCQNNN